MNCNVVQQLQRSVQLARCSHLQSPFGSNFCTAVFWASSIRARSCII